MTKVITIFIYQVCVPGRLRALSSLIRQDRGTVISHFAETLSLALSPAAWDLGLALFGYITWVLYCKGHPSESESTPHWPRPCCLWAIVLGTQGENRLKKKKSLSRNDFLAIWGMIENLLHLWDNRPSHNPRKKLPKCLWSQKYDSLSRSMNLKYQEFIKHQHCSLKRCR